MVVEEERHGSTRADGLGPNVGGTVAQLGCPAKVGTCLLGQKLLGGLGANARNHGHVEGVLGMTLSKDCWRHKMIKVAAHMAQSGEHQTSVYCA